MFSGKKRTLDLKLASTNLLSRFSPGVQCSGNDCTLLLRQEKIITAKEKEKDKKKNDHADECLSRKMAANYQTGAKQ